MHRRRPEIFNSDQGSQFTSEPFVSVLEQSQIKISMDGRGRAYDNIFIERLWRTVKYENLYLREYETMVEATMGLRNYFEFYNQERLHQSLDYQTPAEVYQARSRRAVGIAAVAWRAARQPRREPEGRAERLPCCGGRLSLSTTALLYLTFLSFA